MHCFCSKIYLFIYLKSTTKGPEGHVLAIAHSLLLDLEYGTVCQPSCEILTSHSDNFGEHSKRTDSCSAEWQCFSCAVYKFTYLLTYFLLTYTVGGTQWYTKIHHGMESSSSSSSSFAHKTPLKHARWDTREQDAQGTYCAPTDALNN